MNVLSDKTQKIYKNANARLAAAMGVPALTPELLADAESICARVEKLKRLDDSPLGAEAQKGHLNALMSLLERGSELWAKYSAKVRSYNKSLAETANKQEMTKREEAKWLSWEEILAVRDKLKPDNPDDFIAYQDWVILCLYTMLPPLRADFSPMRVYEELPPTDTKGNFVVLGYKYNGIVLQEYKTAGVYGRQEIEIPDELLTVLYEWVIFNPTGWLLVREDGEPYTEGNLSQRVGRIMERATRGADGSPGKVCGITMFRHAYKTWLHRGEPTILDAEAEARRMLHSPQMAQKYRRPKKE